MNHTWTCSQHPCWGIMRPNEVKSMNTPSLLCLALPPIHHRPPPPSLLSVSDLPARVCRTAARCEHACIIAHLPPDAATDSAATVVMRTGDCAWKQKRSGLIRLGSASERLLAGVGGRLMRKHKASAGLSLSLCLCVWAAQRSGMSESLQPHRPTHTHTHTSETQQAHSPIKTHRRVDHTLMRAHQPFLKGLPGFIYRKSIKKQFLAHQERSNNIITSD